MSPHQLMLARFQRQYGILAKIYYISLVILDLVHRINKPFVLAIEFQRAMFVFPCKPYGNLTNYQSYFSENLCSCAFNPIKRLSDDCLYPLSTTALESIIS